ncbi:DUF262 domain-containing protein [Asaia sp. VD9]|uniref:DUF262 domain-containing protein n=1 Tax=Asaia sp. VD9 TaxID=3081235 RepID=UPI00301A7455
MSSDHSIELRPINRLLYDDEGKPARYFIPAYQRGYRWTENQVEQLLNDIWEFVQESDDNNRGAFYCLQPLVVRRMSDGRVEVVDGQQRLTTLFLLLSSQRELLEALRKKPFMIEYQTRYTSFFLDKIDTDRRNENADFFHICQAKDAIARWFERRDGLLDLKLIQHLLNPDEASRNVRVIWYELAKDDDAVAAFTRLNVGKIPLTEAELVRALFLRRAIKDDHRGGLSLRIANEWDQIEKRLQDDAFWYFLQNESGQGIIRIGLILQLVVAMAPQLANKTESGSPCPIFDYFSECIKRNGAEYEWDYARSVFLSLQEWFENRTLFHTIGFMLNYGGGRNTNVMKALIRKSQDLSKREFGKFIGRQIFVHLFGRGLKATSGNVVREEIREECDRIHYGRHSGKIRDVLLLFNLTTLLEDARSNIRFQFDSFKREHWDIEHIRSVSDSRPVTTREQDGWLRQCLVYLRGVAGSTQNEGDEAEDRKPTEAEEARRLSDRITLYLEARQDSRPKLPEDFERIDRDLLRYFREENTPPDHGLGNLTLLDSATNRSYKNAVFAVKRHTLLQHDKSGIFVPLCTRNVFLKAYSREAGGVLLWSANDAQAYRDRIVETLSAFFERLELPAS